MHNSYLEQIKRKVDAREVKKSERKLWTSVFKRNFLLCFQNWIFLLYVSVWGLCVCVCVISSFSFRRNKIGICLNIKSNACIIIKYHYMGENDGMNYANFRSGNNAERERRMMDHECLYAWMWCWVLRIDFELEKWSVSCVWLAHTSMSNANSKWSNANNNWTAQMNGVNHVQHWHSFGEWV